VTHRTVASLKAPTVPWIHFSGLAATGAIEEQALSRSRTTVIRIGTATL